MGETRTEPYISDKILTYFYTTSQIPFQLGELSKKQTGGLTLRLGGELPGFEVPVLAG